MTTQKTPVQIAVEAFARKDYDTAKDALEQALEVQASNPEILRRYAETCQKVGAKDDAWEALRRLLILEPANTDAANRLALLVVSTGRPDSEGLIARAKRLDQARKAAKGSWLKRALGRGDAGKATAPRLDCLDDSQNARYASAVEALGRDDFETVLIQLRPLASACRASATFQYQLGVAFMALKQDRNALAAFDAAVAAGGRDAELLGTRIVAAVRNGTVARAEALLAEVPEAQRGESPILVAEATLHEANGRIDAAFAALDRAEARGDESPEVVALRAALLAGQGQFDALAPTLETWIGRAPLSARPFYFAASAKLMAPGTALFDAAEALAENPDAAQDTRARACFALARALDQAGEHARAFSLYERANMQVNVAYDAARAEHEIAAIRQSMTAEVLARAEAGDPARGAGLIFVCGVPRSGSTLAETILGAHPETETIGESQNFLGCVARATELGYPERSDGLTDEVLAELAQLYLDNLPAQARESRFVIDKELSKYKHLGLLRLIFPGARIIHTRRAPMDVCYSVYTQNFRGWPATYRLETLAHFHKLHDEIMAHWAEVMPGQVYELRYEALVDDPEPQIRALVEASGMPFHPDCLDFHKSRKQVRTASVAQVRSKIYRSAVGAWERHAEALEPLSKGLGLS